MIYIYKITHLQTGKVYIGQTARPKRRWIEHKASVRKKKYDKTLLSIALKEYGASAFSYEILCSVPSKDEAYEKEIYYVALFRSSEDDYGFNMSKGGKGNGGIIGPRNGQFGKKNTKLSLLNQQRKGIKLSPERVDQIRKTSTGRKHTEESKRRMSEKRKASWANGVYSSPEYRRKMSLSKRKS